MLATLAERAADGRRLALRGEVGRLPRARLRPRRRGAARLAERQRPDRALPGVAKALAKAAAVAGLRRRRRGLRARRARAGRASRRCSRARPTRRSSTPSSTCSRSTASRVVDLPLDGAARAARGAARRAPEGRAGLGCVRRRRGALRRGARARARGRDGEAPRLALPRGKRTRDWLKIKTHGRAGVRDLRLDEGAGPARRHASARSCSATYRGRRAALGRQLRHGLHRARHRRAAREARAAAHATTLPFAAVPKMPKVRKGDVVWVEPKLVCEVEFAEWTHDGHLRAPSFQGLRDDKPARAVHREQPVEQTERPRQALEPRQGVLAGRGDHEGRPARLLPRRRARRCCRICATGRSRCAAIPTARSARRSSRRTRRSTCPSGSRGSACEVSTREKPRERKWIEAPIVNDEDALLWMVNMGCIDMNTWYSRVDKPDRPDFVLFDLDPSPDVGFKETVQVALLVKEALDALGLVSRSRRRRAPTGCTCSSRSSAATRSTTRASSPRSSPARSRARIAGSRRRSGRRRSGAACSSTRTRTARARRSPRCTRCGRAPGAPVSTPLRWDEVNESLDPSAFTMDVVLERVAAHGDLFAGVLTTRQRLDRALKSLR